MQISGIHSNFLNKKRCCWNNNMSNHCRETTASDLVSFCFIFFFFCVSKTVFRWLYKRWNTWSILSQSSQIFLPCLFLQLHMSRCNKYNTHTDSTHLVLSKILQNIFCLTVTLTYYVCTMNALSSDIKSLTELVWNPNSYWIFSWKQDTLKGCHSFPCSCLKKVFSIEPE